MRRDTLDLALKIVATLVAIFGVWKFFADRTAAVQSAQSARSLSFIHAYADERMIETRNSLFAFWRENGEYIAQLRSAGISEREYILFARVAMTEYPAAQALEASLFRLGNLYDQVWHCREAGLCDPAMLDAYFCERVALQAAAYAPFYQALGERSGYENFGLSLRKYRQACEAGSSS